MSIGIISEDNNKYKKANNISLKNYLNSKNYSFIETNGKYEGVLETVFVINDITKDKLLELGQRYGQESVIFLDKYDNQLIFIESNQLISLKKEIYSSLPNNINNYIYLPYYGYLVLIFSMKPGDSCGR